MPDYTANRGYVKPAASGEENSDLVTQEFLDQIDADMSVAITPDRVRLTRATNQSIADDAAYHAISFSAAQPTGGGGLWASGAPTRITAPADGWYFFEGGVEFAANATGSRTLSLRVNGSTIFKAQRSNSNSASASTLLSISALYRLAAGDYVELVAFQNSGGALNVNTQSDYSPVLSAEYRGEG